MRGLRRILTTAFLAAGVALTGGAAQAAKFKVLHSFCSRGIHETCGDGNNPGEGLAMDPAGNYFGTTTHGGIEFGTAFQLKRKPGGGLKFSTIFRFCANCGPTANGPLIIDTRGNLYGAA